MPSTILSIIIAVASAVGKTFIIGAVGYLSVIRPKGRPLLPVSSIDMLSRLTFNMLMLPMIFTGLGSSVTWYAISSLWLVILASFGVIFMSFVVSTSLAYMPCFRIDKQEHFGALRTAICFPNIVAIPILLFPSLCEYEVFHEFGEMVEEENEKKSFEYKMATCEAEANAVVFTYFFGFSILFWSFGHHVLKNSEKITNDDERDESNKLQTVSGKIKKYCLFVLKVTKDVFLSPGFIILILAFITACIKPLQTALFKPGGHLRVIGSTLEAFSNAGALFATIVVAAALADSRGKEEAKLRSTVPINEDIDESIELVESKKDDSFQSKKKCNNILLYRLMQLGDHLSRIINGIVNSPTFKIQVWHILSRLFVTPALIFVILLMLDCKVDLSPTAKLVLLVNSSLPGALIVVVILKANGFTKSASIVSQTYLPSYALSVITTAVWTSLGMAVFSDSDDCS